jgi:hypothetical protein
MNMYGACVHVCVQIDRELADLEKTHGDVKSKQRDTESDEQSDDSDRAVTAVSYIICFADSCVFF